MQGRFVDRVQAGVGALLGLAYKTVTITYFMFYCKEFYNLLGEVIFFGFFMDARSST
jgi:hypothetical protein